jgi:hypothetical protein
MDCAAISFAMLTSAVSATLICSGLTKLAAPKQSRDALIELDSVLRKAVVPLVGGLAALETGTGLAMLVPTVQFAAAVLAAVLGVCFAGMGVLGRRRGSTLPCGCFGRAGGRPLGASNIAVGGAVAAGGLTEAVLSRSGSHIPAAVLSAVTAVAVCLLAAALNRTMIADLIRPAKAAANPATADL